MPPLKAVEAFPGPLVVILGGKDKGSPYTPLRDLLHERARLASVDRRSRTENCHRSGRRRGNPPSRHAGTRNAAGHGSSTARRYGAARASMLELRSIRELRTTRPRVQGISSAPRKSIRHRRQRRTSRHRSRTPDKDSDAKKFAARQKTIRRDARALPDRRSNGLQRLGHDRQRTIRRRLHFPAAPADLRGAGNRRNVLPDEHGLSQTAPAARRFHRPRGHDSCCWSACFSWTARTRRIAGSAWVPSAFSRRKWRSSR